MSVWKDLHEDTQKILEKELNTDGIQDKAIFTALYPAVLSNAQNTVKRLERNKAQQEGKQVIIDEKLLNEAMQAALVILEKVFKQSRDNIKEHSGVFISDCSAVAKRWGNQDPREDLGTLEKGELKFEMKPKTIASYQYGADFFLTLNSEQQKLMEQQKVITDPKSNN